MAKTVALKGAVRKAIGRTGAKATRRLGLIPGTMYGRRGTQNVQFNGKELEDILHHAVSGNVLVDLEIENEGKKGSHLALIQDIQVNPVTDCVLHVDLHEVSKDEKIHAEVRLIEVGEAPGVKLGGIMEAVIRSLKVECLPQDLPESILVDVSKLEIGQSIHVGEITLPSGVLVLNPKELPVFAVLAPIKEEVVVAQTDVVQPEAIKEKKTDEAAAAPEKGKSEAKAK